MHTLLVVEIIFYAIALLLFIACFTAFIRKWFLYVINSGFTNVVILLRKKDVMGKAKKKNSITI